MNVVLFGMMGAGKTTVALALSRLTGKSRVDTDEEIVKKYGPIKEIFSTFGEGRFRELETETARSLSRQKNLIIATGGGFVLNPENVAFNFERAKGSAPIGRNLSPHSDRSDV